MPEKSTPNGYDRLWVEAINHVMEDRESDVRIADLDDELWERFIGPLCDAIEDGYPVRDQSSGTPVTVITDEGTRFGVLTSDARGDVVELRDEEEA